MILDDAGPLSKIVKFPQNDPQNDQAQLKTTTKKQYLKQTNKQTQIVITEKKNHEKYFLQKAEKETKEIKNI